MKTSASAKTTVDALGSNIKNFVAAKGDKVGGSRHALHLATRHGALLISAEPDRIPLIDQRRSHLVANPDDADDGRSDDTSGTMSLPRGRRRVMRRSTSRWRPSPTQTWDPRRPPRHQGGTRGWLGRGPGSTRRPLALWAPGAGLGPPHFLAPYPASYLSLVNAPFAVREASEMPGKKQMKKRRGSWQKNRTQCVLLLCTCSSRYPCRYLPGAFCSSARYSAGGNLRNSPYGGK